MYKNIVQPDTPHMTMWCMRVACWVPEARSTHWEYKCNSYCFSIATVVARTLFNLTLHGHSRACLLDKFVFCSPVFLCFALTSHCISNADYAGEVNTLMLLLRGAVLLQSECRLLVNLNMK